MNETDTQRISQEEERREAELGGVLEQAEAVAQGVLESVQAVAGTAACKAVQVSKLRDWASANGLWTADADSIGVLADKGKENEVRLKADVNKVVKLNNFRYSDDNLAPFFARIEAHNAYFPDCKLTLTGFAADSEGRTCALLEQPYIISEREATANEIREELQRCGFRQLADLGHYTNSEHEIYGALPENVLMGIDGNLYFVGVIICEVGQRPNAIDSLRIREHKNDAAEAEENHGEFQRPTVTETRPKELECDVVRFQNNKDKWVAFVGLLNGRPYEIFTGLQDDDEGIVLPKTVTKGKIIKQTNDDGTHRYDFQFENKRGYKTTVEGLSQKFNPEYWNYAKLISGVLRYNMPIDHVMKLVGSLQLNDESINTWKTGVERALKKYIADDNQGDGQRCPLCGHESLILRDGNWVCTNCGATRPE